MIILGIDPGLARTGYGLIKVKNWREKKYEILNYGCLTTSPRDSPAKRLYDIYQKLKKIIEKYRPNFLVLEKIFFAKNVKTAFQVSEVRGVVLFLAQEEKILIDELTPLQVKMGLTGYGRASKKQIQKMVKFLLKLKKIPQPDDAADALAIALCGVKLFYQRNYVFNH